MEPTQQTTTPTPATEEKPQESSLQAVLASEEAAQKPKIVDPDKLQDAVESDAGSSKDSNPYFDQQVKPGQTIGYGVPTNQQVTIPIVKGNHFASKKFLRMGIYSLATIILIALLIGLLFLVKKLASHN